MVAKLEEVSFDLYVGRAEYTLTKGIIIADTKFEIGMVDGKLILIDEVLTPDSSRFWPLDQHEPGRGQSSFDKQFLYDYLSSLDWNKQPSPSPLPAEILEKTQACYLETEQRLTS